MRPAYRGLAVALAQCLIVLSAYGKYALDRNRLPRAWARAVAIDPMLPLRGRYISVRLEVETPADMPANFARGHMAVHDGRLYVEPDSAPANAGTHVSVIRAGRRWSLLQPVAFFLPDGAADPSRPPAGKALWMEVSVPRHGPPRPIRVETR